MTAPIISQIEAAIRRAELTALVADMEHAYGRQSARYRGWVFYWEYPGYGHFAHDETDVEIWATPDHDTDGTIAIDVIEDGTSGNPIEGSEIPFLDRSAASWFAAVKPWLDKYTPESHETRAAFVAWIRSVCATELDADPAFPFFHCNYRSDEDADAALLRIFREERPNHRSDLACVRCLCHG